MAEIRYEDTFKMSTDAEIVEYRRNKQLRTLKASNDMHRESIEKIKNTDKIDNVEKTEQIRLIEQAIEQNYMTAQYSLGVSREELDSMEYVPVRSDYVKKYEERLKKRGITDEELHRMEAASVSVEDEGKTKTKRSHQVKHGGVKRKKVENTVEEEIVRLPNEEELMKKTLVTDDRQIEERMRKNTQPEDKVMKKMEEIADNGKIDTEDVMSPISVETKKTRKRKTTSNVTSYKFDISNIPEDVKYDIIPLPSNGQCYPIDSPLRSGRIPVAYLTAMDENLISSPNMYRDGKIIDIILERKILLENVKPSDLVNGDRDAIVLWLRATGYDTGFPIVATHPKTGKKYDVTIDLSKIKYLDFNLEGNDDGNFEFVTKNSKDKLLFNFTTKDEENEIRDAILEETTFAEQVNINRYVNNIRQCLSNIKKMESSDISDIEGCLDDIETIINDSIDDDEFDDGFMTNKSITRQMTMFTKSVNGNTDRDYIKRYIENMRSAEAFEYRKYVTENKPGVNFEITINVPESDGGGSFNTFLRLDDTVFINI